MYLIYFEFKWIELSLEMEMENANGEQYVLHNFNQQLNVNICYQLRKFLKSCIP